MVRKEAAKKKKEEAARKRAEALANGEQPVDKLQQKLDEGKKMANVGGGDGRPDYGEHFQVDSFDKTVGDIKRLSEESSMRKINAQRASKAFKKFIASSETDELDKKEFIDFGISVMKKYDFCDTKAEEDVLRTSFDEVFETFDYDRSGKLDSEEIANCLSLMCGGSINEKIYAAFNMFDVNNTMTLSFDELNKFIKCVFQIFAQLKDNNSPEGIWATVDIKKLTLATTEKCF